MNYFKILHFIQKGDKSYFDVPVYEQEAFLDSLGSIKDDIDRGYKQYLCQNYFVPRVKVFVLNLFGSVILPFLVIYFVVKGLFDKPGKHIQALIEEKGMREVIPKTVFEKYNPNELYWKKGSSMSLKDVPFLIRIIRIAPLHPYFVLKAWMNVVLYSYMIRKHRPKVMIQFGEFSFSSSILTEYCHIHGIRHIDIMHGEKLFCIRDAFFHYDECYVWDEHYTKLFCSLKAEPTQFRVAVPESISINTSSYSKESVFANYKYYLAAITEKDMETIIDSLSFVQKKGQTIKYRPHPRYTDVNILRKYVKEDNIEDPSEVGILESISNLEYAIGSYTTVLSQAYFSGKKVILDDVTYKEQFEKLKSMRYILAEKNLDTLSNFQVR